MKMVRSCVKVHEIYDVVFPINSSSTALCVSWKLTSLLPFPVLAGMILVAGSGVLFININYSLKYFGIVFKFVDRDRQKEQAKLFWSGQLMGFALIHSL